MSGSILVFSPQSKTFVPRAPDGKFAPKGPMQLAQQGVVANKPPPAPGPQVIAQQSNRQPAVS